VHDVNAVLGGTAEIAKSRGERGKHLSQQTYELLAAIEAKGTELHAAIEEVRNANRTE
jgi:hypothetical protein